MDLILGFLDKKDEEEDSNRIPLILEECLTNDSVIHPVNLKKPVGGMIEKGSC